jgi:hypothetical protein
MMANTASFGRLVNGVNLDMTALAGGAQPTLAANTCSGSVNTVTTVATDNDSVLLPADRVIGDVVYIANLDAAQDIKVYPPSGGTINGAAANASLIAGQQTGVIAVCIADTGLTWVAFLTGVATPS